MKERDIQKAIVNYIKLQYPNVLYCASAGGLRTSIKQARMMKATGYVKGFPDLMVMEPVGKFHGLFLEIKTKKGRATKEQLLWRHKLNGRNYVCEITYGFEETKEVIDRYINNKII
jgi:hypothetical protein|tara:strand:- start:1579 stop:1926 length:348 start_codon:yes stop_codon:yes gene_type:complete